MSLWPRDFRVWATAMLGTIMVTGSARAADEAIGETQNQLHFRVGDISGNFSGSEATGSFSSVTSLDAEYEKFYSNQSSFLLRLATSYESSESRLVYLYTGAGWRHYFWSTGRPYDVSDSQTHVTMASRWRYYFGLDAGLSQVSVTTAAPAPVEETNSTVIEAGGNFGLIYQVSKNVGLEAEPGMTVGLGFSSVPVGGTATRILFGMSYFF
jgi:hypothetical protein